MSEKNYYFMLDNRPWAGPNPKLNSGPPIRTTKGKLMDKVDENFKYDLVVEPSAEDKGKYPPCDYYATAEQALFSDTLVSILNKSGVDNIQYYDADVNFRDVNPVYKVGNIIGKLRIVDEGRSEVNYSQSGLIMGFDKIVFDEEKASGQKIFRLGERIALVVVHRDIKEAIEAANLHGIMFVTDEEWQPGMV